MCTAVTYKTKDFYIGRTLDYEFSYGEEVVVSPRKFPFDFLHVGAMRCHHAIIGMAHIANGYPLYYDAINEMGVGMAGLNFVGNAGYADLLPCKDNVAQFELIPRILCQCASVSEARVLLQKMNLVGTPFSKLLGVAQLHWIIADENEAVTVECIKGEIKLHDNAVGVLTNNPPFEQQMLMLSNYAGLSARQPKKLFSDKLPLDLYSRGMGAIGLPGDLSSASRFARAAFVKTNSASGDLEEESVGQFFHILGSVEQQRGCCEVDDGKFEVTIYTSCCNASRGIYYYTTYENRQITAVDMHREDLDGSELIRYPLVVGEQIYFQN